MSTTKTWLGTLSVVMLATACNARVVLTPDDPSVPTRPTPTPPTETTPIGPPGGDPSQPVCGGPAVAVLDPATSEGYSVSSYTAAAIAPGAEIHVIGVYETRSDHSFDNHPRGAGSVHVSRPDPPRGLLRRRDRQEGGRADLGAERDLELGPGLQRPRLRVLTEGLRGDLRIAAPRAVAP